MTGQKKSFSDVDSALIIDLIGQAPLPIAIIRLQDGSSVYISPGFTDLFGYTLDDMSTLDEWRRLAYPDQAYREYILARWEAMIQAAVRGENDKPSLVAAATCKDGTVLQIELSATLSRGHMIAMFKDVTDRVKAEEALCASERYNRMLFESSPVGLALNRMDGLFTDVNPAFARIVGYSVEELLTMDYWALTPDDYIHQEALQQESLQKEGRYGPYEKEYIHKLGHRVPVLLNGVLIEQGGEVYVWSSIENVSERQRVEVALRESEQRERARAVELETVLDSVPVAVFIAHDAACEVITGNRAGHELIGVSRDKNPSKTAPYGDRNGYRVLQNGVEIAPKDLPMQRVAASGIPLSGCPLTIMLEDGTERHTLANVVPLFDSHGKSRGSVGVFADITEQLKVEMALRESEQRERARSVELETVLDSVPLPVFIAHDVNCGDMTGNQAAYEFIGMPKGSNPSLTAPEEQRPNYRTLRNGAPVELYDHPMHRAAATGQPVVDDPLTIIWEDGTERQALNSAVPLFDNEGKVRGAVGVSIDITEQLKAKKALEVSLEEARIANEQLKFQFDHLPVAYIVWSPDFRVTAWNPAAGRVFGWTSDEAIGHHAHELMAHGLVQEVIDEVWRKITQGGAEMEYSINENITKDGKTITCEWFNSPLHDNAGNVVGCLSMVNDISQRIYAENQLRLASSVFEDCREAIVVSDNESHILAVNPAFTEVTGYAVEEVLGKDTALLLSSSISSMYPEIGQALISKGHWQGEVVNRRKNGEIYPSLISVSAIKDANGKIINRIGFFIDITNQRKAEDELRQSQKLQSIGTLAGGISHDLNNLLTPIIGLTEIVLEDLTDEESKESLQDVLSAAERAQRLVGQILAFSRKDAPNRRRLSLAPTLEKTIDLMRVTLPSNVRIKRDIHPASEVDADETQMQQIIMNLCSNAAHAMGLKGGDLLVSLKNISPEPFFYEKHPEISQGEYVEILVRDTGYGMNQHILSRIFEPFFTTKEVGEGTGMGLSVVHGIVTAHQGVIEVESEFGKGATFRIFLPAAKEEAPEAAVLH